ncbi:MAG: hypothetical protein MUF54_04385 [Polyangiaceae bacterium]|jgi:hypothetical protein|nr:hypothetical protein [Polyangiaceae bacterium]
MHRVVLGGWTMLVGLLVGCSTIDGARFRTASELPDEPRKPDGVAVDLEGASPAPKDADSTTNTLVILQEPVHADLALDVVRRFFRAVAQEDLDAIRALMSSNASLGPISSAGGPPAAPQWERRLRRLDYDGLGGEPVFRESTVQTYRHRDLGELVAGRPSPPPNMGPDDVLIRVPIARTRIGVDRLFGDEILFLLRRIERQYQIRTMYEDFQPP